MLKNSRASGILLLIAGLCVARPAAAQSDYYRHVFFDNSIQRAAYFQSSAARTAPSELRSVGWRLPVESTVSRTAPNAIRIEWQSAPGGSWDAQIQFVSLPEPISGLCRGDAFLLGLFAGSHRGRRSAQRGAVRCARRPAGGDHARQLHRRGTARELHGRPSRRKMGAGPHSVREAPLGVRLPVPLRAPAKRHLPPAARGRKKARADRRRHPDRRRTRGGRRRDAAGAGRRVGEGVRPPHRRAMAGARGKRRSLLRRIPLDRRRAVPAGRHAAAGRQSLRRLHRPLRRQSELPRRRRRLGGTRVGPRRPSSRRRRAK